MTAITSRCEDIAHALEIMEGRIALIRGQINRKFAGEKEAPPEPPEEKTEKDLSKGALLAPDGKPLQ